MKPQTDSPLEVEKKLRLRLSELEKAAADGEGSEAEQRLIRAKLELIEAEAAYEKVRQAKVRARDILGRLVDVCYGRIDFCCHYEIARTLQAEPGATVHALLYDDGKAIDCVELKLGEIEFRATLPQRRATPDEMAEIQARLERKAGRSMASQLDAAAKPSADTGQPQGVARVD